ncbi:hypothetical protein BLNAU_17808 [Blattamonas nauphoetae]|uniref:Uncharacterized protein n=1 Tax=Blattamonas nauphoetae TaxID=2049346 RepID=A0ABQ9WQZ4_9EUKA|nr:hypothetical protein BLNAU_23149 [Blattamonas nauphoetae]KAK2947247.1 hypothetical protein BLNAU_17808 [Blattamonas nauphoetae]
MPQEPKMSMSANKLDATIHFYTKPPSISLDGSWRDLSDVSNLVDWLIVLKVMKLKPSLVKKVGIETTQARNHSFGSMHLDEIAEVVLDRLWREREVQTYQNGMAKKVGEEDDDVDNLIEFLALTGDRSEEDALLTVLKDKTGQHVLAKVGSGKSEDIMQSIFRPREHTSLEKEDKHKGRSNASLKNSGNMIDFQDSANNTIQQSPFLPINVGAFWCLYDSSFVTPRLIWGETDREDVRKEANQAFWSWTERRRNEKQADRDKSNKKTRHSSKLTPPPQSPLTSPLSERRAQQTTPFRAANSPSVITTMITPSSASTSAAVSFENPHRLVALPSRSRW